MHGMKRVIYEYGIIIIIKYLVTILYITLGLLDFYVVVDGIIIIIINHWNIPIIDTFIL